MKTLKLLQKSMNLNTQKSLYLAAILAGDKLLPLGMLGEHVIVKTTLAEKVFATELAHKLLPLQVGHLVVNL